MKRTLVCLIALLSLTSAAGSAPLTAACVPGGAYDSACDVDHDGDVDIFDIQLAAGHWGQTGTYNIYPAMVPKTGQTTCYDDSGTAINCPGTGQDGDWQKGVAWPNPRFTDNGNGTVTDNLTGLIWLKDANCFSIRPWATALTDANTLNSGECGLTDGSVEGEWRLPNVREMQSLIDYERFMPALPSGHPFTIAYFSIPFWTSSTTIPSPAGAWAVSLYEGSVLYGRNKSSTNFVWPVRGGQ